MPYIVLKDVNGHVATFEQESFTAEVEQMVDMPLATIQVCKQALGPANLDIDKDPQAVRAWFDKASVAIQYQALCHENGEGSPDAP
jgi:hypothetical protein